MLNHNLKLANSEQRTGNSNLANSEQRTANSKQVAAGTAKGTKNRTGNLNGTGKTTISNALKRRNGKSKPISKVLRRRAQAVIKDKSIDAQSRALIRYALEINDPWLPELVRRANAGETIIYTVNSLKHPHTARM